MLRAQILKDVFLTHLNLTKFLAAYQSLPEIIDPNYEEFNKSIKASISKCIDVIIDLFKKYCSAINQLNVEELEAFRNRTKQYDWGIIVSIIHRKRSVRIPSNTFNIVDPWFSDPLRESEINSNPQMLYQ